jgi:cobalt-zinc-cadmium efflux system protein
MLTNHVMLEHHRSPLELPLVIQNQITTGFGIKHLIIQLEPECCNPDDIHCDLQKLTGHHHET